MTFRSSLVSLVAVVMGVAIWIPAQAAPSGPNFDSTGFVLNPSLGSGAGSFATGNVGAYTEGSCVPVYVEVTNNGAEADIDFSVVYDYHHAGNSTDVVGIENIEGMELNYVGDPDTADNLSDFNFLGSDFSGVTGFESTTGTIGAYVYGPYGGKSNADPVANDDKERHYDVTLQAVPADTTVYVLFCGRLGLDASEFPGSSMHINAGSGGNSSIPIDSGELLILPALTIQKVVADGTATPDQWSFNVSPMINGQSTYSIVSGYDSVTIDNIDIEGDIQITEGMGPDGYSFAYGSGTNCDFNGSIASTTLYAAKPQMTATCVFTNSMEPIIPPATTGTLIVVKNVINDNNGTSTAADFELTLDHSDGGTTSTQSFYGNASGTTFVLEAGTYSVTEASTTGYTASFSTDCIGSLAVGETKTCTVTNDDNYVPPPQAATGTIVIIKNVINDDEGTGIASDFTLSLNLTTSSTTSTMQFAGNATGTTMVVEVGEYEVTEADAAGYNVSYSGNCSGYLNEGDLVRCVVTNDDIYTPPAEAATGTLIIIKEVINDQGGEMIASDFNIRLDLTASSTTSTMQFAGNASGTSLVLETGNYIVTEDDAKGYRGSMSEDCRGYLAAGEVKTCTITNNDYSEEPNGRLIVVKEVINDNGLNGEPSDFTIHVEYMTPRQQGGGDTAYMAFAYAILPTMATTSFPGNASGTELIVGPGSYSVQEETYDNYNTTYSDNCSGTILAGQTITCVITNNDKSQGGGGGYVPPSNTGGGGGGGFSGGLLEPTPTPTPTPTPRVLGIEDEASLCVLTEVEALYVSSIVNEILGHLGIDRDVSLEEYFNAVLTPRVTPVNLDSTLLAAVQNYVNYGTESGLRLGQGERAGVVNSFRAVYGRVPLDECDWQNAIKIGNTTLPLNLNTEREKQIEETFRTIYGRSADRSQEKDDIAINIMTYGIRPQIRDLKAENAAIGVFEQLFGKVPETASEWDANRAIAYSGIAHSMLGLDLTNAPSRMMSIRINNEPIR